MNTQQTSQQIYTILDKYRKNPHGLNYDGAHIISQIEAFVDNDKAITCLFPACHGKIDHPDLLVDHRADLSEFLCVEQLVAMNDEVRSVYAPGLEVFMVHEGHFYVDTGLIRSDDVMDEYLDDVRKLTSRHPFIHSLSLREFYPQLSSAADARSAFLGDYCSDEIDTCRYGTMIAYYGNRIRTLFADVDFTAYGDYVTFEEFVEGKALEQLAIWIGFRRMLADKFGPADEYVRFSSVYKDPDVVDQIALNYVPDHHLEMPSFYSVCQNPDGGYTYLTLTQAIEQNYQVRDVDGYRFFVPGRGIAGREPIDEIMAILESHRKNPFGEFFDNSVIKDKIAEQMRTGRALMFVLPGFHGKTNNPDFVFGPSIDMGDKVALDNLTDMLDAIKSVYAPGATLYIVHECHFYVGRSPLVGSQYEVDSYLFDFRRMIGNRTDVKSVSVYEMLPDGETLEDKLEQFFTRYCPSVEETGERIAESAHLLSLYTSYKKVNEVHQKGDPRYTALSCRNRKQRIKDLASVQMQIVFGFGALIKEYFADMDYVRFSSLYKAPEFTDCMAINYLPGNQHMSTPTFHCLVRDENGGYDFIRKVDAHSKQYRVAEIDGLKFFVAA